MSDLERGTLVRHATLGLGKVVALEPDAVHVFFPGRGERYAAKLRLPGARAFLKVGVEDRDAWLEGLSSFSLDAASGRWALPARWLTLEEVIAQFLGSNPRGFSGDAPARAAAWRGAQRLFAESLGGGEAERLLDAGDLRECVKRLLRVAKLVGPLIGEEERDAAEDAFGDDEATRRFLRALFELLAVPSPSRPRFDKLHAAATGLPVSPGARWLLVTLFPFLGRPDRHPLLRPGSTREAAERLGFDLRFDESPNWTTQAALRAHAARLLEALAPSGAKDFIDVEVFTHAASTMRAGGKRASKRAIKAAAPKASPAPKAPAASAPKAGKGAAGGGAKAAGVAKAKGLPKPAKAAKKPAQAAPKRPAAKPAKRDASVRRKAG